MNTAQRYAMLFAAANLVLVGLFPPYDYVSMLLGNVPTFDGFYFVLAREPHQQVNLSFLTLEIIVVLTNACIAFLMLRSNPRTGVKSAVGNSRQRATLGLVGINLVLVVLFPPFENISAITRAALPTFEGFYFILGDNPMRQIVTPILYIETALILINGALLWLVFRDKTQSELARDQMNDLARKAKNATKR